MERIPLTEGSIIEVNQVKIRIIDCTGEGSTCLAYTGKILEDGQVLPDTLVTVKEFYPTDAKAEYGIGRLADGRLHFSEITKSFTGFLRRREQFEAGYQIQKKLANSEIMEITVKPFLYGSYGDSSYIISDIHMGKSLDRVSFFTLSEKLSCAIRVVELFSLLHEAGYMMLDFKPENFLWIGQPRMVKLIDTDSVISVEPQKEETDFADRKALTLNTRYCAPEILLLKEMLESGKCLLAEKRGAYLKPRADVYSLGLYLFELLFERMPTQEDLSFSGELLTELMQKYSGELNREAAAFLLAVIRKAMHAKPRMRFENAGNMMNALNQSMEQITFQKYVPKKTIARANYTYLAYNMLEQYPLYEYAAQEGDTTVLRVAVIGRHAFRESLLKAVLPCGQMLASRLELYFFDQNSGQFWEQYTSASGNPEICRTVEAWIDRRKVTSDRAMLEAEIVEQPLAVFRFYTDTGLETVSSVIRQQRISYIVLMTEEDGAAARMADALIRKLPRRKHFVAYLTEDRGEPVKGRDKITVCPVSTQKVSDGYDEDAYRSRIYNMGLSVHAYYYRGYHPRATLQEIRESYAGDWYNIESSERSALHANYKLKSVGIDPKSARAPYRFYEKVLSSRGGEAKKLFDELVVLEHRSWTAFLVVNGVQGLDKLDDSFEAYAYDGKNDWKKKDGEGRVVIHPVLKYCRPGRKLTADMWENESTQNPAQLKKLDPLDRRSLEIYLAVGRIAERRRKDIFDRLKALERPVEEIHNDVMLSAWQQLLVSVQKVYDRETSSSNLWQQSLSAFRRIGEGEGLLQENVMAAVDTVAQLMQPALWMVGYHDFKCSDEDVIRVIPRLLIEADRNGSGRSRITIVKPVAKSAWQNLYSSIVVQPDLLVLVLPEGEDTAQFQDYGLWLKKCNVDTQIQVKTIRQLREYGGKDGMIFLDETGITPDQSRLLTANPYMKSAHTFQVENRVLKPTDGNDLISLFHRAVNLTVAETIMLHGGTVLSEHTPDAVAGLSIEECRTIWNLYRRIGSGYRWKLFIENLVLLERNKKWTVVLEKGSAPVSYESAYAEAEAFQKTGIGTVFARLWEWGCISQYSLPADGAYGKARFVTEYPLLAGTLLSIISQMANRPAGHSYDVIRLEETVLIRDDSLYAEGCIPHEPVTDARKRSCFRDEIMWEVLRLLDRSNKDKVLQNIRFDPVTGNVSFRYASNPVKEVLKHEGSILEALIYLECKQRGVFDDIRANVVFQWGDRKTRNEIDIIGTKNSRTCFISAKLRMPELLDVYEIEALCSRFAIEGEALLVSSFYATGKNEMTGQDYEFRPVALEERVSHMEHVSYIGKDGVDAADTENGGRQILIASSIEEIIGK